MGGRHAAPQRERSGRTARYAAAAVAVPPAAALVIAASLALSALCGAFLLALFAIAAAARVPPRAALRAMALGCWPVFSLVFPDWPREAFAGAFTSAACLAALAWLRARQREQWRETGGRMGRQRRASPARVDANTARIESLEARVGAMSAAMKAVHDAAETAPAAPERHLRVVRDDDTKPLPAATA